MLKQTITGLAVLGLALAASSMLTAKDDRNSGDKRSDVVKILGQKLGMSEKQQQQIRQIHNNYEKKIEPLAHQLWMLHHEECDALKTALTDQQRARLPEVLRTEKNKEFDKILSRLDLSNEQRTKIEKMRDSFAPRFHELAQRKGENAFERFRELKHEAFESVCRELKPDQIGRLMCAMKDEFRLWRDPEVRRQHLRSIADQLGFSEQQRDQEQKILDEYNRKIRQPAHSLREIFQEEKKAFGNVLTPEQTTKWLEMKKQWGCKDDESEREK